jgi:outer membrane receptor protein involved in Fe transport
MLGINNAFDENPPVFLSNLFGLGYDAANSDAIGRFVSLRLTKSW